MHSDSLVAIMALFPELLKLANNILTYINKMSKDDPKKFILEISQAITKLNRAETIEERQDAAQAIAKTISKV